MASRRMERCGEGGIGVQQFLNRRRVAAVDRQRAELGGPRVVAVDVCSLEVTHGFLRNRAMVAARFTPASAIAR